MTRDDQPKYPDKIKERNGYVTITAKDYRDLGEWDILLADATIHQSRRKGLELASELANIVPDVLANPTAIFMGIRWEPDENRASDVPGWLCYVGIPIASYNENGIEMPPFVDEVFLVFVNQDRVVYHFRWDKCCMDATTLPIGHETRFGKRVL